MKQDISTINHDKQSSVDPVRLRDFAFGWTSNPAKIWLRIGLILLLAFGLMAIDTAPVSAAAPPKDAAADKSPRIKKSARRDKKKRKGAKKKASSDPKDGDVLDAKPGVINKKGDKELDPRFDPKTLGKTKNLKSSEDINVTETPMVYSNKDMKYPCKKIPLDEMVSIDFQNVKLEDFTKIMACFTGKRFMLAKGVTGQITIMSPEPVTMYEAYKAFLSALEVNNLTIVKRGKFYRIVQKTEARAAGAEIMGPGRKTPRTDNVVTQLIPVRYVDAQMVVELLKPFATTGADITVYEPTSTLILTEVASNIRRLRKLIKQVDLPSSKERVWIRPIEFADAADVQKQIEAIFGKSKKSSSRGSKRSASSVRRGGKNAAKPATSGALGGGSGEMTLYSDERTNQLIIRTDKPTYMQLDRLIRKLDVPIPGEGQIHIHHLQHADAKDVQSTLQALTGSSKSSRRRKSSKSKKKGRSSTKSSGSAAMLSNDVKVTAHEPTNSLVIEASLKDYTVLRRVIRQLDVRRRQVYLESVIMEITSDKNRDFGMTAYGGHAFDVGGQTVPLFFGGSLGPDIAGLQEALPGGFGALLLGPLIDGSLGSSGSSSSSPSAISIPAFGFTLKALQSNSDVNILQTPHILTMENEEAEIEIGRKVPFNAGVGGGLGGLGALGLGGLGGVGGLSSATSGLGSLGLGSTLGAFSGLGSIQYADIKISLKLKPTVNESNHVRLEIEQQIDDFDGIDPATKAPNTSNRRVKNVVVVKDQQPVVIGGLMTDREVEGVRKVPVLGDIPLLGVLFRQTTTQVQRKNLLMIIIPHIIDDPSDLKQIQEQRMEEIRNFAEFLATRKKEFLGQINYSKKHGILHEIHRVVAEAREERYQLEQQKFDNSELDPVGPPETHELFYDPYEVKSQQDNKAFSRPKKGDK